jgi:hypothetical protein
MKKTLLIGIFFLIANAVSAQVLIALFFGDKLTNEKLEFGLNVGVNRSSIINLDTSGPGLGLNIGMSFLYKFNDRWQLNPMVYYSFPMGAKGVNLYETKDQDLNEVLESATIQRKIAAFSLPVTLRYRLFNLTYLDAGPQFNWLTKSKDVFTASVFEKDDLIFISDVSDQYKKIDVGMALGIAQKIKQTGGVTITARYYNSLFSMSKDTQSPRQYNSIVYLGVTIPFGKMEKESL